MKEAIFVKINKARWKESEGILKDPSSVNPDRLAETYVQITDDLSFARTHYEGSNLVTYLNNLASKAHHTIYRNKKEKSSRFLRFWSEEIPDTIYTARRELTISLIIFVVSMAMGALSAANDHNFVRLILGDAYVDITLENIEKGDPMAIYKSMHQSTMFVGITFNNIRVSFYAFAAGLFTAFGTGFILFSNGIMLGAFQYFFIDKGLFLESFLTIFIHGTLEISAIIIAGGAGICMGNSFLFPGSYARIAAFRKGAKKGVKIIIGLVPVFIMAGFLESFVTRYTEMPNFFKLLIILLSLTFLIYYFIYLPFNRNLKWPKVKK